MQQLSASVRSFLETEPLEAALARDPGLQVFAEFGAPIVRSIAARRVAIGLVPAPGAPSLARGTPKLAPRAAASAPAPRPLSVDEQLSAAASAARCKWAPTFTDEQCRTFERAGYDARSGSQRAADTERGAELDRLMGLVDAPERGVHFDAKTGEQTFGASKRAVREPTSEDPRFAALDASIAAGDPSMRRGVEEVGLEQRFGVMVPAEPRSVAPRLAPTTLAAAASGDRRKVGAGWREV